MKLYDKKISDEINYNKFLTVENTFYYENDAFTYLGSGEFIEADSLDTIENTLSVNVTEYSKDLPFIGGFFGIFNYDLIKTLEKIPQENKALLGCKNINGLLVKTFFLHNKLKNEKYIYSLNNNTVEGEKEANVEIDKFFKKLNQSHLELLKASEKTEHEIKSNTTKQEFMNRVKKAQEYIKNGDIFQVVLSQRFEMDLNKNPILLLEEIPHEKSTFKYYFNLKNIKVLGISPEILVKREGEIVKTNPIAGTRKRGKNEYEEKILEKDLITDEKERAEHTMLVDLARNDMGKIADIGSVMVRSFMDIKKYNNVIHLTSEVLGKSNKSNIEILKTFLPAGTLTGAPKIRAMEIIERLEKDKREIYGGAIGYLSFNKKMETAISIRTMIIKDKKAYIQAGAGIVYDSVPEREYEETQEKAIQLINSIKEV